MRSKGQRVKGLGTGRAAVFLLALLGVLAPLVSARGERVPDADMFTRTE